MEWDTGTPRYGAQLLPSGCKSHLSPSVAVREEGERVHESGWPEASARPSLPPASLVPATHWWRHSRLVEDGLKFCHHVGIVLSQLLRLCPTGVECEQEQKHVQDGTAAHLWAGGTPSVLSWPFVVF